jgi:nucleoporin SEH1
VATPVAGAPGPTDSDSQAPTPYSITSVAWAPSCGRSYHLIATGGRDGRVRIWRVKPAAEDDHDDIAKDAGEDSKWTATVVADFDHHK